MVTDELFDAALGPIALDGDFIENALELLFGSLASLPSAAPSHHGGRNGIVSAPCAIGVLEEIRAGIDTAVHVRYFNPFLRGLGESRGE